MLGALLIGGLLAVQASVNLRLNQATQTPFGAATLQLACAATVLAALTAITGSFGALGGLAGVPGWVLLGGLASPFYITSAIVLLPRLGALASIGLFVTGQMLVSLLLDATGWLSVSRRALSLATVAGAVIVLAGITVVIAAQGGVAREKVNLGWVLLGLAAGGVLPAQGAINAALMARLHRPFVVALTSFAVATLAIAVVYAVLRLLGGTNPVNLGALPAMPWWGWLGGVAAAAYVTATFLLIPVVGAATTVALTVTGQQAASAAIDHHGWFRLPRRGLDPRRLAGLVLLVAGGILVRA